jgi:poly-gamma-glutamate synthesis protein (capsule biosynthesis protein)
MFLFSLSNADYQAKISPISKKIENRMIKGGSYHKGCPVELKDLRYLRMSYIGFDNRTHTGEMIVHKSIDREVTAIFRELYRIGYPIHKMKLVSSYGGSDWLSIENDNTSAFNCRKATNRGRWSKHAYGKAIDINPIENPYIHSNGKISHKASYRYKLRRHKNLKNPYDRAMLISGDRALKAFIKRGWFWGRYFKTVRDLQHFQK